MRCGVAKLVPLLNALSPNALSSTNADATPVLLSLLFPALPGAPEVRLEALSGCPYRSARSNPLL